MCYRCILFVIGCLLLTSCKDITTSKEKERILEVVREMEGKTIHFSHDMLANFEIDSLLSRSFKLVVYIDSAECTECNLALDEWSIKIREMNQINNDVAFLFVINSNNPSVVNSLLSKHRFYYPVFIDSTNSFFKMNSLSKERRFQMFLLNSDNKIVLVGDPIRNDNIWMLYKKELRNNLNSSVITPKVEEIQIDTTMIDLGDFPYDVPQNCTFTLQNVSKKMLVINRISVSCGCVTVSYNKEPVQPGKSLKLKVHYSSEHPEYFSKTIIVYCNAENSPIVLKIRGDAK